MAQSNAERQAAYRARHLKDENGQGERISLLVDIHAKRALERLAIRYAVTQRAMIERLIADADKVATGGMTDVQHAAYINGDPGQSVTQ